jgi:hypothetical protein
VNLFHQFLQIQIKRRNILVGDWMILLFFGSSEIFFGLKIPALSESAH